MKVCITDTHVLDFTKKLFSIAVLVKNLDTYIPSFMAEGLKSVLDTDINMK